MIVGLQADPRSVIEMNVRHAARDVSSAAYRFLAKYRAFHSRLLARVSNIVMKRLLRKPTQQ